MQTQVPVTERALFSRINRKLNKDGEKLHRCRERWQHDLGRYYIADENKIVAGGHFDLENLGRELGVLKPFETLENN